METKQLINIVGDTIKKDMQKLKYLKDNISSSYLLAKQDFITIDNYEDSIETLAKVLNQLEELQKRIIKRNKGE